jgi:signal transduction histidine kinase
VRVSDSVVADRDRRDDLRSFLLAVIAVFVAIGVGTVPQSAFQAAVNNGQRSPNLVSLLPDIAQRIVVNLVILAVALILIAVLRPLRHTGLRLVVDVAVLSLAEGFSRGALQILRGFYAPSEWRAALVESVTVSLLVLGMTVTGLGLVWARRRIREQERASARQTLIAAAALDALATEELRVRRDVAEGLHGTVQQNLVLLAVRVDAVSDRLTEDATTDAANVAELRDIRNTIDGIRETDVRTLSQLLYPVGIELGAVAALRLLLQRLPGTIASSVHIDDAVLALEGNGNTSLTVERRLLLVRLVEEALSNALRHGRASAVRLTLELDRDAIVMTFDDDGYGLGPAPQPSGLARFRERLVPLGGSVDFGDDSPLGGTRLTARVPVDSPLRFNPRLSATIA